MFCEKKKKKLNKLNNKTTARSCAMLVGRVDDVTTYSYAAEAAELGAVRAETSVPQLLHADETAEHFSDALGG